MLKYLNNIICNNFDSFLFLVVLSEQIYVTFWGLVLCRHWSERALRSSDKISRLLQSLFWGWEENWSCFPK